MLHARHYKTYVDGWRFELYTDRNNEEMLSSEDSLKRYGSVSLWTVTWQVYCCAAVNRDLFLHIDSEQRRPGSGTGLGAAPALSHGGLWLAAPKARRETLTSYLIGEGDTLGMPLGRRGASAVPSLFQNRKRRPRRIGAGA
ncbi:hypothetical protein EVAR_94191_1 [Eumeta japonica]|uniref:Uncharacterized protein n=1 Tax=Eumeta variegata TaxID=151549 RepID=A0A4C1UMX6_EUMVA|nr:hypothetical protein EVAR_94191_1 [Eumeta japonica]